MSSASTFISSKSCKWITSRHNASCRYSTACFLSRDGIQGIQLLKLETSVMKKKAYEDALRYRPTLKIPEAEITYIVSYLEDQPECLPPPASIAGWIIGNPPMDKRLNYTLSPEHFIENDIFRQGLHDSIKKHCKSSTYLVERAKSLKSGWMNIVDRRSRHFERRTPPEDIFGSVLLKDGEIVEESYTAMDYYRLLTSDGIFQMDPDIEERFIEDLLKSNEV